CARVYDYDNAMDYW
nr:immunoglobulin heavy chain junction region [Mus musculus]MBK4187263.1 immunoglobulin heavy chain junction region [Mus musculus]MBK4187264.1 immunoglobulin heavy chain junction region [Mus musculus]